MRMMKEYRKIKIEDSKTFQENRDHTYNNNFIVEKNIPKIAIIILISVIFLVFLAFYFVHTKIPKNSSVSENVSKNISQNFKNEEVNNKYEKLSKEIKDYEKTLRKITEQEIAQFRQDNSLGILYDKNKYKRSENPDITVVTTMYNQAHCIYKAIRSVQNQSLKNIEMIIVDDCSLDNSTETVEELMKEDERIILVKHDSNEGIMITRNEAIRMAKGKYITMLDADDTLLHKDILSYSLHVANMADLDVVEFWTKYYREGKSLGYYHYHSINSIISQPELKYKFISFSDEGNSRAIKCRTVWSKIVKNNVLQKTLQNIPSRYLYDYILGFEDTMITVSLYQVAETYYCLSQPGYYYTFDERRNKYPLTKKKQCKKKENPLTDIDHIKFMQFLVDKLDDNKLGKQILYHEIKAINNYSYSNFKRTITHHFNWTYSIFDYLLNSSDITEEQRKNLQKIKNEIKENEKKQNGGLIRT